MIGTKLIVIRCVVLAVYLTPVLMGCTALSTGASMRVEVEVYKGPLSKHREVQLGEIIGVIREAKTGLQAFQIGAETYARQIGCLATNKSDDCKALEGLISSTKDLLKGTEELVKKANKLKTYEYKLENRKSLLEYTNEVSALAIQFKAKAFFIAEYQLKTLADDRKIRAKMTEFTSITSEFSNQMAARTTVLQKQYDRDISGYELAVSDHLRDAGPTAFLNLYDWYRATYPKSKTKSGLSAADRVRLAQQLFANHYWTKINEVYASGQGDVSMALIKDDIGNWNLKSFENNPTKLLNAYRELSLAGIQAAVQVAKTIPSGGTTAALDLASQFALGRIGSTRTALASSTQMKSLHKNTQKDLSNLLERAQKKMPDLEAEVDRAENAPKEDIDAKRDAHFMAENVLQEQEAKIAETEKKLETQKCELEKIQTSLDEVETQRNDSPDDQTLLNRKQVLKGREEQQQKIVRETNTNLETLRSGLEGPEGLRQKAKNARDAFNEAMKNVQSAEQQLADALTARRDFAVEVIREARKILEVHRRVIKALMEAQTSASSSKPLVPLSTKSPGGSQRLVDPSSLIR